MKSSELDRSFIVACNLYQLFEDLKLIKEAQDEGIRRLQRMSGKGGKSRMNEARLIVDALGVTIEKCDGILNMTGRKSKARYVWQSESAAEKHRRAQDDFLQRAMGMEGRSDAPAQTHTQKDNDPYKKLKDSILCGGAVTSNSTPISSEAFPNDSAAQSKSNQPLHMNMTGAASDVGGEGISKNNSQRAMQNSVSSTIEKKSNDSTSQSSSNQQSQPLPMTGAIGGGNGVGDSGDYTGKIADDSTAQSSSNKPSQILPTTRTVMETSRIVVENSVSDTTNDSQTLSNSNQPSQSLHMTTNVVGGEDDSEKYPRKIVQSDTNMVVIYAKPGRKEIKLPMPENNVAYSIREFLLFMDEEITKGGLRGWKEIVPVLNKLYMLKVGYKTLRNMLNEYVKGGRQMEELPDKSQFVINRGRPRLTLTSDREDEQTCKKRQHSSITSITDVAKKKQDEFLQIARGERMPVKKDKPCKKLKVHVLVSNDCSDIPPCNPLLPYPQKIVQSDRNTVVIYIKQGMKKYFILPMPENCATYSIREFLLLMDEKITNDEMTGWKALVPALNKLEMLKVGYKTLQRMLKEYIEGGRCAEILPDKCQYAIARGRPRLTTSSSLDQSVQKCNERQETILI